MRQFSILCCLLCFSLVAWANPYQTTLPDPLDDSGWALELEQDGIQIYTRAWTGSSFIAVKLKHNLKTGLSNVVGNIIQLEAMGEWVDDLKEARLISDFDAAQRRIVYIRMGLPWPMEDRDLVTVQQLAQDQRTRVVTIRERAVANAVAEVKGVTRVARGQSEYVLTATDDGTVDVIWQGHNEPGGLVPAFLANWMIENIFYDSTINMRARFEDPKHYRPYPGIVDQPASNKSALP